MKNNTIRLSEAGLCNIVANSVKKVLKEGSAFRHYDKWALGIPDSWNKPDIISKDDLFDAIKTADEEDKMKCINWVKEDYGEDSPEVHGFLNAVNNGENPFIALMNQGLYTWEDIARDFYDIKPVSQYPDDRENPNIEENTKKKSIRLNESRLNKIVAESIRKTINEWYDNDNFGYGSGFNGDKKPNVGELKRLIQKYGENPEFSPRYKDFMERHPSYDGDNPPDFRKYMTPEDIEKERLYKLKELCMYYGISYKPSLSDRKRAMQKKYKK